MTSKKVTVNILGPQGSGKSIVFSSLLEWLATCNSELGSEIAVNDDESVAVPLVFLDQVEIEVTLTTTQTKSKL